MTIKSILLVDDDEDDHMYFKDAINSLDPSIEIKTAINGKLAYENLKALTSIPDIIFLDLNMPIMNGYEFLMLLKKDKEFGEIPIGMYTTSNSLRDIELTRELGALFFITKPKDFSVLCFKLKQILDTDLMAGRNILVI